MVCIEDNFALFLEKLKIIIFQFSSRILNTHRGYLPVHTQYTHNTHTTFFNTHVVHIDD